MEITISLTNPNGMLARNAVLQVSCGGHSATLYSSPKVGQPTSATLTVPGSASGSITLTVVENPRVEAYNPPYLPVYYEVIPADPYRIQHPDVDWLLSWGLFSGRHAPGESETLEIFPVVPIITGAAVAPSRVVAGEELTLTANAQRAARGTGYNSTYTGPATPPNVSRVKAEFYGPEGTGWQWLSLTEGDGANGTWEAQLQAPENNTDEEVTYEVYFQATDTSDVQSVWSGPYTFTVAPEDEATISIVGVDTPNLSEDGKHTFVSTDAITVEADIAGVKPGADVRLRRRAVGAGGAAGVELLFDLQPIRVSNGRNRLTFRPADFAAFNLHRTQYWTRTDVLGGGDSPNAPISFTVKLELLIGGQVVDVAEVSPEELQQDEKDCLRQEYVDFAQANLLPAEERFLPAYQDVKPALDAPNRFGPGHSGYNTGNYANVQLDGGMQARLASLVAALKNRPVVEAYKLNGKLKYRTLLNRNGQPVRLPSTLKASDLVISAGFRCPRRNYLAGSVYPNSSRHTRGRALDIVPPNTIRVVRDGRSLQLNLHNHIYPTLLAAAQQVSQSAITEQGAKPVPAGTTTEDHVHMQW
jgi:hypothetical protein